MAGPTLFDILSGKYFPQQGADSGTPADGGSTVTTDSPAPPDIPLGPYQYWKPTVTSDPLTGKPRYSWTIDWQPSYLAKLQGGAGNEVGLGRNAIDQAHYERADAAQALRDAADALYQRGQLGNDLYKEQATGTQGLLDTVSKLVENPQAGPMGLSAYARYGGGMQNQSVGTGGVGTGNPYGGLMDQLLVALKGMSGPDTEFSKVNAGTTSPDAYGLPQVDPNKAPAMTPEQAAKAPNGATGMLNGGAVVGYEDGGKAPVDMDEPKDGMTIGGQKHYIVNENGDVVANLTEDNKPETVRGIGGVEVIPEDPERKAAYLQSKQMGEMLGNMMAGVMYPKMNAQPPNAETGASIGIGLESGGYAPIGLADGGTVGGSWDSLFPAQTLRPSGGATMDRQSQIGSYFHPTDANPLPTEATSGDFNTRLRGYAKLLGAALSAGNTAVPVGDLQALNAGKAPQQLLSAQALGTLAPSQRNDYFAMLQQMGLGEKADNEEMIKQGRPAAMQGSGSFMVGG